MKRTQDRVLILLFIFAVIIIALFPSMNVRKDTSKVSHVEIISIENYRDTVDGVFISYTVEGTYYERVFSSKELAIEWLNSVLEKDE